MTKLFNVGIALLAGFYFCAFTTRGGDTNGCPPAEEIIRKLVERSRQTPSYLVQPDYSFTKLTEREEFDSKGRIKERKSSSNEMFFSSGVISKKRNADPVGAKKMEPPGKSGSAKPAKPKPANRGENINLMTDEILGKYDFTLLNRTNLNGRPAFELAFEPKRKNASGKNFMERLLNRTTGKLWVDVEEFELARMQVHLESEMWVGGGLIGSLKKAVFILERARLPEGLWLERSMKTDYEARMFLESTRVITKSESLDFRKRASKG